MEVEGISEDPQLVEPQDILWSAPNPLLCLPCWFPWEEVGPGSLARTGIAPGSGTSVGFPLPEGLASVYLRWELMDEGSWQPQNPPCR